MAQEKGGGFFLVPQCASIEFTTARAYVCDGNDNCVYIANPNPNPNPN